jgi:hypothetical protein
MRQAATAADRIDYWIRRRLIPFTPAGNPSAARGQDAVLTAIGRSLKDQYDALEAPVPPHLAALAKRLQS